MTFDKHVWCNSEYEIQSAVRLIYRKHMNTGEIVIRTTHVRPHSVNLTCAKFANHGSETARKKYRQPKIKKSKNSIFLIKKKIFLSNKQTRVKLGECGTGITLQWLLLFVAALRDCKLLGTKMPQILVFAQRIVGLGIKFWNLVSLRK